MKEVLLETWLVFAVAIWLINGIALCLLPCVIWNWFHLEPIFIATSLNFGFALNIYLNRLNKLNKL